MKIFVLSFLFFFLFSCDRESKYVDQGTTGQRAVLISTSNCQKSNSHLPGVICLNPQSSSCPSSSSSGSVTVSRLTRSVAFVPNQSQVGGKVSISGSGVSSCGPISFQCEGEEQVGDNNFFNCTSGSVARTTTTATTANLVFRKAAVWTVRNGIQFNVNVQFANNLGLSTNNLGLSTNKLVECVLTMTCGKR